MKKPKLKFLVAALPVVIAGAVIATVLSSKDFHYVATIEATEVDLSSRVSSLIAEVPVNEGDQVRAGQAVVRLAAEDLKIGADAAERDFDRAKKLFKAGSMPSETYEHLRSKREEAALRYSWATVSSPITGRVLTRYREPGEWVTPGMKLLTLANLEEVWAIFYVEQPMLAKISLGMTVRAVVPEIENHVFDGKVARISGEAEFTPKNVQTREERTRLVYGIKVVFANPGEILKPGMSIETRLGEK